MYCYRTINLPENPNKAVKSANVGTCMDGDQNKMDFQSSADADETNDYLAIYRGGGMDRQES